MANYNVDIAVAIKGAQKLTQFTQRTKALGIEIQQLNKFIKFFQQDNVGLVKSVDNLNSALAAAKANFNAAASGTSLKEKAARQLIIAEKELNKELKEQQTLLQKLNTTPLPLPGTGRGRNRSPQSFKDRNMKGKRSSLVPGESLFGQSVTVEGGASGRSRQILAEEQALQEALARMDQRDMKLTGQSVNIEGRLQQALAKQTANRKKAEEEVKKIRENAVKKIETREKKLILLRKKALKQEFAERRKLLRQNQFGNVNPGAGGFRAFSQRADQITAGAAASPNRPGFGQMVRSQFAEGGMFAGTRNQRIRGATSSALIGGGFPLLFGQGGLGAALGGIGGAAGGALGGGFGFGLSIAGTALAQQIQQTLDFRKSIRELNKEMQQMGISSNISGSQVRQLGKSLGITKEEAVKALQEFKRFGNDAVLIAKKFGGDFGRFDALAQANTVESALSAIRKINKDLTLEDELRFILSVQRKGVEATINDILTESLEKQKELDTAGFGQGVGGRKRPKVLEREREQLNEINTENTQLIEKLTNIRDLNNEIRVASEDSSFSIVKGLQDVNAEIRKLNSAQFQVVELSKTLGSAFSESFKGIIKGTMSVGDAFRSMFMRIADHFLDMAAQMMAAQISRGFMGLFANAFGGGASSFFIPSTPLGIADSSTFLDLAPPLNFANGGNPPVGRASIVGERGPELFVPNSAGTIIPNHDLGGGTNIVVNVDASGSSVEGDEENGRELGRMISVAIQSELIKQKRPGGLLT
nr:phage tape measure protein [uncultured Mediterranean phage uvMED]